MVREVQRGPRPLRQRLWCVFITFLSRVSLVSHVSITFSLAADAWFKLIHRSAAHPKDDDLEKDAGKCTDFGFASGGKAEL